MIAFPNCKINLGLNILWKREDGFHELETVFYPLPLQDILEIIPQKNHGIENRSFISSGMANDIDNSNNLCTKAYALLKKRFPQLPAVQMQLHKSIPSGAGLGGGSADASFTLKMLNQLFNTGLSDEELRELALELGSDCPFFIINRPCVSKGRGEKLEEIQLDLSTYKFIIVNPGIHIDTGSMFRKIKPAIPGKSLSQIIKQPVTTWKDEMINDFEKIAFQLHPAIKKIKDEFYKAGAIYASMSGSGSTVYGIFSKTDEPVLSLPSDHFMKQVG